MRIVTHHDPDLGTIAAAYDEDGEIVATAADSMKDGVYVASDESSYYEATGQLLPVELWDQATEGE